VGDSLRQETLLQVTFNALTISLGDRKAIRLVKNQHKGSQLEQTKEEYQEETSQPTFTRNMVTTWVQMKVSVIIII